MPHCRSGTGVEHGSRRVMDGAGCNTKRIEIATTPRRCHGGNDEPECRFPDARRRHAAVVAKPAIIDRRPA
jgi:hypothetical protein